MPSSVLTEIAWRIGWRAYPSCRVGGVPAGERVTGLGLNVSIWEGTIGANRGECAILDSAATGRGTGSEGGKETSAHPAVLNIACCGKELPVGCNAWFSPVCHWCADIKAPQLNPTPAGLAARRHGDELSNTIDGDTSHTGLCVASSG